HKPTPNRQIGQLPYLNHPQKSPHQSLLNPSNTPSQLQHHLNQPKSLNNPIKQLRHKLPQNTNLKQTTHYINHSTQHQPPYHQPLQQPQNIINQIRNPTLNKSQI
ncbi:GA module-containing protein, partial [Staphylococcus epidermidis]|uniref:GA module-containing protein n=1 Tax=Staphylococcus epidermidis TaxID=1282 RepID=UPI001C9323B7